MAPTKLTLYYTMTYPNTIIIMRLLNKAARIEAKLAAAGFKIVREGKEKYPLSILKMVPIATDTWKKRKSFESLADTIQAQMEVHGTTDLVSFIISKIPLDVTTVYMELSKLKESVMSDLTNICIFYHLVFLHSNG